MRHCIHARMLIPHQKGVTLSESRAAMTSGLDVYRSGMDQKASAEHLPLDDKILAAVHSANEIAAMAAFE